tara:strand:+ start:729 stop:986 length:258 start_codon:yes stop_codon:yes gene_type:complete
MEELQEINIKNENDYIEMVNHLKEIYEKNEEEKNKYKKKYTHLYKLIAVIYGLVRTYDNNSDDWDFDHLLNETRDICCKVLFDNL